MGEGHFCILTFILCSTPRQFVRAFTVGYVKPTVNL